MRSTSIFLHSPQFCGMFSHKSIATLFSHPKQQLYVANYGIYNSSANLSCLLHNKLAIVRMPIYVSHIWRKTGSGVVECLKLLSNLNSQFCLLPCLNKSPWCTNSYPIPLCIVYGNTRIFAAWLGRTLEFERIKNVDFTPQQIICECIYRLLNFAEIL